ncbi:TetR/AcrR family transcriptional regulator [Pseudonocardia humida]|uniref:TetR/AcrR family transcriptional regulator n=1 Tax=Pseudonocardia humida TaxID=2800819 RepID=A0ABT1A682_9PSEU|nr:TetR/AcrR family transcriptional regulator [Pseudonocardia humida]MCO1658528.1 TetR/AcrR family transcriptional regulator [Pseudonocardia humida]
MEREQMRGRLLDAAERILRQEGAAAFSVRAVTAAAGVNVASVTTAFGGRSALVEALFRRVLKPVDEERRRRFAVLAQHDDLPVRAVVAAFVEPLAVVERDSGSGASELLRLLVTVGDPRPTPLDLLATDPGLSPFDDLLGRALPTVPAPVRATRVRFALGTVFAAIAWSSGTVLSDRASLDELLTYVTSGLLGLDRTP